MLPSQREKKVHLFTVLIVINTASLTEISETKSSAHAQNRKWLLNLAHQWAGQLNTCMWCTGHMKETNELSYAKAKIA